MRTAATFVALSVAATLAALVLLLARSARGADLVVTPGQDLRAAILRAQSGDRVLVRSGTYAGGGWIGPLNGRSDAPITVVSADGYRAAVIRGGAETLRVGDASSWIVFDGFEITGCGSNCVHVDGRSHDIVLRNLYVHDAGTDGDVIKLNQAQNITIDRCDLSRPGPYAVNQGNPYQQCLDAVDVVGLRVRDSFLHDGGSQLLDVKGGSSDAVIERTVFARQGAGASDPLVGLGGATDASLLRGSRYEATNVVFRNNVLVGGAHGALGIYDVDGVYVANNLFVDNDRVLVEFRAGNGPAAATSDARITNNVFADTRGRMPTPVLLSSHGLDWWMGANTFWNAGSPIPTGGYYNVTTTYAYAAVSPGISPPAATADRCAILAAVRPRLDGAVVWLDARLDPYGVTGDFERMPRTARSARGPFGLAGTAVPNCAATAAVRR